MNSFFLTKWIDLYSEESQKKNDYNIDANIVTVIQDVALYIPETIA